MKDILDIPLDEIKSVALRRIVEEVRNRQVQPYVYNRVYTRHNRS